MQGKCWTELDIYIFCVEQMELFITTVKVTKLNKF